MSANPTPPAWVHKRDGRLVPFEPERIARDLFLAGHRLGRPDSFLARELTDSVLHFLALESEGTIPTTAQVAELVEKVVRELGQPELARAHAEHIEKQREALFDAAAGPSSPPSPPAPVLEIDALPAEPRARERALGRAWLCDWSLDAVFTPELAAAHHEGLIVLGGLDCPFELAACTLEAAGLLPVPEAFEACRGLAGHRVALDGPEHLLVHQEPDTVARFLRELSLAVRATGLLAAVNLNADSPPLGAESLVDGPLFDRRALDQEVRLPAIVDELATGLLALGADTPIHLDWHLGERDFEAALLPRLVRLVRSALEGKPVAFVFDRDRQPVMLDEGIDRRHSAVLIEVGLDLPRLAGLVEEATSAARAERFVQRLGSVVRLAASAAGQKRRFLRQRRPGWPAFLLDRARALLVPLGLESVVRDLFGQSMSEGGPGLEFARHVVDRIRIVLAEESQRTSLEGCLGSADRPDSGASPADEHASLRNQLRAAGRLHAAQQAGSVCLHVNEEEESRPERIVEILHAAWKQTEVPRVRLIRAAMPTQQWLVSGAEFEFEV